MMKNNENHIDRAAEILKNVSESEIHKRVLEDRERMQHLHLTKQELKEVSDQFEEQRIAVLKSLKTAKRKKG